MTDECKTADEVFLRGRSDGNVDFVHHRPDHTVRSGVGRVIHEGQHIPCGEALILDHIDGNRFEVAGSFMNGPTKVATRAYRDGWDRIFIDTKAPAAKA